MRTREIYSVTIHPGQRTMEATARLAKLIIDRWMPGHAGGAVILAGPNLCQMLHPLFIKAKNTKRDISIRIDTSETRPVITEMP